MLVCGECRATHLYSCPSKCVRCATPKQHWERYKHEFRWLRGCARAAVAEAKRTGQPPSRQHLEHLAQKLFLNDYLAFIFSHMASEFLMNIVLAQDMVLNSVGQLNHVCFPHHLAWKTIPQSMAIYGFIPKVKRITYYSTNLNHATAKVEHSTSESVVSKVAGERLSVVHRRIVNPSLVVVREHLGIFCRDEYNFFAHRVA